MEIHWHYKILGAESEINGQYFKPITISVIASTEEEALDKASIVIKAQIYKAIEAQECVEQHGIQADLSMLQLEIQKQLLDLAKGRN